MNKLFFLIFLSFFGFAKGQYYSFYQTGYQLSLLYQVGSHEKSLGLRLNTFIQFPFFQTNFSSSFLFYKKSFGQRKHFFENKNELGIVCFFGKKNQFVQPQLSAFSHQTPHEYALSYASIWYFDNVHTSQRSGAFGLQLKKINVKIENDAFAGIATDRFRTGLFQINFLDSLVNFGTGFYIWTGETTGVPSKQFPFNRSKKYKDVSSLLYGKTSHGIWFLSGQIHILNAQFIQLKLGIDSEEIRNTIQNRFLHDLPFLPRKFQNQTPHYPRLNENGLPVFSSKEAKKATEFYSVGINAN